MDIDNYKFKLACNRFGLDYSKAIYCSNVLVVPSERSNIYVTFDKRCNVIDVGKYININGNADDYFECIYTIFNDKHISNITICNDDYSTNAKISLGEIIKLTDKYKYDNKYSRVSITEEDNLDENQKNFISYFSFLRSVGDKYNILRYQMLSCGVDIPDQRSYIRFVINDLNNYINECLKNNRKPDVHEFINYSGQINVFLVHSNEIDAAINLLMKIKGYAISDKGDIIPAYCISVDELLNSFNDIFESDREAEYSVQKNKNKKD